MEQQLIYSTDLCRDIDAWISGQGKTYDRIFLIADEVTDRLCRPLLFGSRFLAEAVPVVIGATDVHKTVDTLAEVWKQLSGGGASRHSLLVNLGGGMVTDLGGFAASTFKRGIDFVNIPTTLLSMVDAAVGGKTGINFNGLKNEIGVFQESRAVVIDTEFLRTLDAKNLVSGYAEMLKHSLLSDVDMWAQHMRFNPEYPDYEELQQMVADSIAVKQRIVAADPHEKGLRKALNLGHTAGHAFESLAMELGRPVLHGYAVAWGLVVELYLSVELRKFPVDRMRQTVQFIFQHFGRFDFTCGQYAELYDYMLHDKKNSGGVINFTLLEDVGRISLDCQADQCLLFEAFDFLREG